MYQFSGDLNFEIVVYTWLGEELNQFLTLSDARGGGNNWGSPKNAQRKICQFCVTFPRYVNGVLETTFCSKVTFGQARKGQKLSKLAEFHKGGPCQEQYEAKITNTYKCQLQHVARNFWVLFMLQYLSLGEFCGWEPLFGSGVLKVP